MVVCAFLVENGIILGSIADTYWVVLAVDGD